MNKIDEKEYKFIVENMPICCVDLVLETDDNKILFVKRKNPPAKNQWWFPGGRILKGETIQQASIRKAKEELGLSVKFERIIGVYEKFFDDAPFGIENGTHGIILAVAVKPVAELNITLDSDHSEFKFLSACEPDFNSYLKQVVEESQ
jgi:colanic acid biosynthesis protein WcaH